MISSTFVTTFLAIASLAIAAPRGQANISSSRRRDPTPLYPIDPNTVKTCTWYWDNDGSIPCASMPFEWGITMENFLKWVCYGLWTHGCLLRRYQ